MTIRRLFLVFLTLIVAASAEAAETHNNFGRLVAQSGMSLEDAIAAAATDEVPVVRVGWGYTQAYLDTFDGDLEAMRAHLESIVRRSNSLLDGPTPEQVIRGQFEFTETVLVSWNGQRLHSTSDAAYWTRDAEEVEEFRNRTGSDWFFLALDSAEVTDPESSGFVLGPYVVLFGNGTSNKFFGHEAGHALGLNHSDGMVFEGPNFDTVTIMMGWSAECAANANGCAVLDEFSPESARKAGPAMHLAAALKGDPASPPGPCVEGPTTLCLNDGRFKVEVAWEDHSNKTGQGQVSSKLGATGLFWFFSSENLELMIKVLDGCTNNGHFWVFASGGTNVKVDITVTDTETGFVWRHTNPKNVLFEPVGNTRAIPTC